MPGHASRRVFTQLFAALVPPHFHGLRRESGQVAHLLAKLLESATAQHLYGAIRARHLLRDLLHTQSLHEAKPQDLLVIGFETVQSLLNVLHYFSPRQRLAGCVLIHGQQFQEPHDRRGFTPNRLGHLPAAAALGRANRPDRVCKLVFSDRLQPGKKPTLMCSAKVTKFAYGRDIRLLADIFCRHLGGELRWNSLSNIPHERRMVLHEQNLSRDKVAVNG